MPAPTPRVRQEASIRRSTPKDRQQITLDSIRELESMLERGDIEPHAYFIKKRALIKLL